MNHDTDLDIVRRVYAKQIMATFGSSTDVSVWCRVYTPVAYNTLTQVTADRLTPQAIGVEHCTRRKAARHLLRVRPVADASTAGHDIPGTCVRGRVAERFKLTLKINLNNF